MLHWTAITASVIATTILSLFFIFLLVKLFLFIRRRIRNVVKREGHTKEKLLGSQDGKEDNSDEDDDDGGNKQKETIPNKEDKPTEKSKEKATEAKDDATEELGEKATEKSDKNESGTEGSTKDSTPSNEEPKKTKNPRVGAISRNLAAFGLDDQEEIKRRLENHLKDFGINERFGIWDRRLLHLAVESIRSLETLDTFFSLRPDELDIEMRNKLGKTAAYKAAEKNKVEIWDYLLKKGASLDCADNDGDSILIGAVKHNANEVVKFLFENHVDAMKASINVGNENNETALFCAVQQENQEITRSLLENGAQSITPNSYEKYSPFHIATLKGNLETVKALFEFIPNKWAKKDRWGNKPIHLAAQMDNDDVVRFLNDKHEIMTVATNNEGMTPLDLAEFHNSMQVINVLSMIDSFADAGDPVNKFPTLAFLKACREGRSDTVARLLREKNKDRVEFKIFRQVDKDFNNCLDLAMDNGHMDIAQLILRDDEWKDALCNDNRWSEEKNNDQYDTPMRKLIRICPKLAMEVLDKCCTIRDEVSDALKYDFEVDLDFRFIEDADLDLNQIDLSPDYQSGPGIFRDLFDIEFHKRYTDDERLLKKNDPLTIMLECNREELLTHPLTKRLLDQRWKLIRFPFLLSTALYIVLALCITAFIAILRAHDLTPPSKAYNLTCSAICDEVLKFDSDSTARYQAAADRVFPLQIVIFVVSLLLFTLEVVGIVADGAQYLKVENCIDHFTLITSIIIMVQTTSCEGFRCDWQWHLASLTVFFAWMAVVVEFQVFADFGVFTLMLIHVVKTFASIFLLLVPFILGFAYAFFAILNATSVLEQFQNESSIFTLIKVGVMTVGEINADDFFAALTDGEVKDLDHKFVSIFFLVLFIILMPIIIMNLLIGLAVGDINEIRVIAEMEKTKNRIETIQGVQYSVRNQNLIKRVSAFLFHYLFTQPTSWRKSSFAVNKSFVNKIRKKFGAAIDPTEAKELKKDILTEEILTMEDKIQNLEVTLKHEMKGIVKESDLDNIKDEILDKIMTRLDQL